ncbi:MAG: hypothetical protein JWR26_1289 [Pedosphaera sp.]|nr:hypothetical protein [Pedosphaera sp.]
MFVKNNPINAVDKNGLVTISRYSADYTRCGFIDVWYHFNLETQPKEDGFIVQMLEVTTEDRNCKGKLSYRHSLIWEVIARVDLINPITKKPLNIKTFTGVDENEVEGINYPHEIGYIKVERFIDFFPLSITGDLEKLWSTTAIKGVTTGHATDIAPSWYLYNSTEPTGYNVWQYSYRCCCATGQPKFQDTAPGNAPELRDWDPQ